MCIALKSNIDLFTCETTKRILLPWNRPQSPCLLSWICMKSARYFLFQSNVVLVFPSWIMHEALLICAWDARMLFGEVTRETPTLSCFHMSVYVTSTEFQSKDVAVLFPDWRCPFDHFPGDPWLKFMFCHKGTYAAGTYSIGMMSGVFNASFHKRISICRKTCNRLS